MKETLRTQNLSHAHLLRAARKIHLWFLLPVLAGVSAQPIHAQQPSVRSASDTLRLSIGCETWLLAVGDSISCTPSIFVHHGDVMWPSRTRVQSPSWSSSAPSRLTVLEGVLVALDTGVATISVMANELTGKANFEILPPVATLSWDLRDTVIQVGDIVRMKAIVRDSSGRVLRTIGYNEYGGVEGGGIKLIHWSPDSLTFQGLRAGVSWVVARLGHRRDSITIVVEP